VLRPWKGTTTGADWVQIDLGASVAVNAIAVNGGNMGSVTVLADNANPPVTNRGVLTLSQDAQGRYKGSLAIGASVRYIRLNIGAGVPNDGSTAWSIACVYPFTNSFTAARDPLYGANSTQDLNTPQTRQDLDNGVVIRDSTGPSFMTFTLDFSGAATDDHEQIQQYARAGLCWLNFNIPNAAWEQFPVRNHDPKMTRKFGGFNREQVELTLKEEV